MSRKQLTMIVFLFSIVLLFQNCGEELQTMVRHSENSSGHFRGAAVMSSQEQVELLKRQACMFDGLLFPASADYSSNIEMLIRSNCKILPRSIETWATPPNFKVIENNLNNIRIKSNKEFIFGMFIAEAISTKAIYKNDFGQIFDFKAMCRTGTQGQWGADTCVPNSESPEFQKYIFYIVEKAMKLGVTDFVFGQLGYLDATQKLPAILQSIRTIAQRLGVIITIGGQPNGIAPENYLRNFDYIITPSYVDEVTPAQIRGNQYSECKSGTNCQAIYFHPNLAARSNAVIAEIDWSSLDDDAHRLGRKSKEDRQRYIYELSQALKEKGVGFILPFRIWYDGGAQNSCLGFNEWIYSASNNFQCGDEDAWNAILAGGSPIFEDNTSEESSNVPVVNGTTHPTENTTPSMLSNEQIRSKVIALYISVMGRTVNETISDVTGINYWVQKIKSGTSDQAIVNSFISSNEYFVRQQYQQRLKRRADANGLNYFIGALDNGSKTRQDVINDLTHFCVNHVGGECL